MIRRQKVGRSGDVILRVDFERFPPKYNEMKIRLISVVLLCLLWIPAGASPPRSMVAALVVFHDYTFVVMKKVAVNAAENRLTCVNRGVTTTFEVGKQGSEVIAVLVLEEEPAMAVMDLAKGGRYDVPLEVHKKLAASGADCRTDVCMGVSCAQCEPIREQLLLVLPK